MIRQVSDPGKCVCLPCIRVGLASEITETLFKSSFGALLFSGDSKESLIGGTLVRMNENLKSQRRSMAGRGAIPA